MDDHEISGAGDPQDLAMDDAQQREDSLVWGAERLWARTLPWYKVGAVAYQCILAPHFTTPFPSKCSTLTKRGGGAAAYEHALRLP
ncbi:hypothetical protein MMC25_003066 [Agyrium rufum]|nr:hypothetical protein [Agyrium rufum]